jgi:hypothetical protein
MLIALVGRFKLIGMKKAEVKINAKNFSALGRSGL